MKKDFMSIIGMVSGIATSENNNAKNDGAVSKLAEQIIDKALQREPISSVEDFDQASAVIAMIRKVAGRIDEVIR
jgi:hypothetical protein